jgi:hypothetical protein
MTTPFASGFDVAMLDLACNAPVTAR